MKLYELIREYKGEEITFNGNEFRSLKGLLYYLALGNDEELNSNDFKLKRSITVSEAFHNYITNPEQLYLILNSDGCIISEKHTLPKIVDALLKANEYDIDKVLNYELLKIREE